MGRNSKEFFKYGLPFVAFVIGGSGLLSLFVQNRIDIKDRGKAIKASDKYTKVEKKTFNLEDELKKMEKKIDIDKWQNKPVPDPEDLERKTMDVKIKK